MKTGYKIFLLSILCLLPAGYLMTNLLTNNLGANPPEALIHFTGNWTIYFLLLTLSLSPLQTWFKPKWPMPMHLIRRVLGLSAMGYALLHLISYFTFDMGLDLAYTLEDIAERPFILLGFAAFLMLIPLSITSTKNWQKRLKRHWQTLHKLIYPITFLGILHYLLLVKADLLWPLLYLSLFGLLMLARQTAQLLQQR